MLNTIQVINKPHFFKAHDVLSVVIEGQTIAQIVNNQNVGVKPETLMVFIDGREIPFSMWSKITPRPTFRSHILIKSKDPSGGGGGSKNIFKTIAVIGLSFLTSGIATGLIPGLTGFGATLAAGATLVVGTLVIDQVFPPPELGNSSQGGGGPEESPNLSIGGQKNRLATGVVPRIYGKNKYYPINAAVPFIQTNDKTQDLFLLFDYGYSGSDVIGSSGQYIHLADERIGETPISNYKDVQTKYHQSIRNGDQAGAQLELYTSDVFTESLSIVLDKDVEHIRTTQPDCNLAQIDITFPRGLYWFTENGDINNRAVTHKVEFREVGETYWRPFTSSDFVWSDLPYFKVEIPVGTTPPPPENVATPVIFPEFGLPTSGFLPIGPIDLGDFDWTTLVPLEVSTQGVYDDIPVTDGLTHSYCLVYGNPYDPIGDYDKTTVGGGLPQLEGYPAGATQLTIRSYMDLPIGWVFLINGQKYTTTTYFNRGTGTVDVTPPLQNDFITNANEYVRTTNSSQPGSDGAKAEYLPINFGFAMPFWPGTSQPIFGVEESTQEAFTVSLDMKFTNRAQYEIRIRRLTVVDEKTGAVERYVDASTWTALRTFTTRSPIEFESPHTMAEFRIRATDQLNGVIDKYSAIATSILPVYNGVTWKFEQSRNPAWIAYDILTGTANPQPTEPEFIDLDSFYDFSLWCSSQAPNAIEQRFLCDVVVDYETTVKKLVNSVLSSGRGSLTVKDGKYAVIFDREPTIPVQLITPHNSSNFSGERRFGEEPHALRVGFIDPDSGWQKRQVVVYNDGFNINNAENFQELNLFGCTRSTQAWRDGRYHLAQSLLRQETFSVTMDVENIVCTRGDYVQMQHDVPRIGGAPSRIESVVGFSITATEPFNIVAPNTYQIRIREPNNVLRTYNIVSLVDPFTVLLDGRVAYVPGNLFSYGFTDLVTDDYLVSSIQPSSDLTATIKLIPLARPIYSAETGPIPPYTATLTPDLNANAPLVINPKAVYELVYIDRFPHINMTLSWEDQDDALTQNYEIYRWQKNAFTLHDLTQTKGYEYYKEVNVSLNEGRSVFNVEHYFKVLAVTASGGKHEIDKAEGFSVIPLPDKTPPPKVDNFTIDVVDKTVHLYWDLPNIPDGNGFIIRYSPGLVGPRWNSSVTIAIAAWNETSTKVNARIGAYLIKAVDTSGNESDIESVALTQVPSLDGLNFFADIEENPTWPGSLFDMEILGNQIQTIEVTSNPLFPYQGQEYVTKGIYEFSANIDLLSIFECRVTAAIEAYGVRDEDYMVNWPTLAEIDPIASANASDWDAYLETRTAQDGVFMADWLPNIAAIDPIASGIDENWTEWKQFNVADLTARLLAFRVRTRSNRFTRVVVISAKVIVDYPDRTVSDYNINSGTGGINIIFTNQFAGIPALGITQDDWQQGDYYSITNKTAAGFAIEFFDSGSSSVARIFDWTAKGFGKSAPVNLSP